MKLYTVKTNLTFETEILANDEQDALEQWDRRIVHGINAKNVLMGAEDYTIHSSEVEEIEAL